MDGSVVAGIMNEESKWNPSDRTGSNFGVPQMSGNMWGDYGGNFGGMDFNTFKGASGDRQIDAYADWLNRSGNLYKGGIDVPAQQDPVMQAALLQAIQFGGNSSGWRNALAQGNMNVPIQTNDPQAKNLREGVPYPTMDSMYNAYDKMLTPQWTGQWSPGS